MNQLKSLILVSSLFASVPISYVHAYNVSDYNPAYTPYNMETAIDSKLCKDEVAAFDSDYDVLAKSYTGSITEIILQSGVHGSLSNINAWFESNELYYSNLFKECIEENQQAEEEKARKEARARYEAQHQADILEAIENCDMEFLENLSLDERMATYDERTACKEKLATKSEPVSATPPVVYTPPVTTTIQEPILYTAPKPTTPVKAVETPNEIVTEAAETTEDTSTTTAATSSDETVQITQDELDRMIEQRVNEALEKAQPEPVPETEKPSVFKRVWNFLFGWW
jgi:hypothetical protein